MGFLEWATSPWGRLIPIHIAWFLIWVAVILGFLFFVVHALYLRYSAKPREFAGAIWPLVAARVTSSSLLTLIARACAQTLVNRAAVSLGHGRLHVHTTVYRLPAESWRPVSMGDLSLDRGGRVDCFHPLSHHPCVLLYGLLGDLA